MTTNACPDCGLGAIAPNDRCDNCGLAHDDLEAAAAFLVDLDAARDRRLTAKQWAALGAVAAPTSPAGQEWWHAARASWPGPRRTLGSLYARVLVDYSHAGGWSLTASGAALWENRSRGEKHTKSGKSCRSHPCARR